MIGSSSRTCALVSALALVIAVLACASRAVAQRTHVVREGQSLARIARRYGVRVGDLAGANALTADSQLRPGQVLRIPEPGVTYVRPGQTLHSIAREAGCSVADLVRLNRLRDGQTLGVGQRLVLPGNQAHREAEAAAARWGRPRSPGVVTIQRTSTQVRARVRVFDARGRVTKAAVRQMARLMRSRRASPRQQRLQPPTRLLELLARVSDHFGGRTIQLISGFREAGGFTRETSRHVAGHAVDIRVDGVPNHELRDYLRTFDAVGVGFYPRSRFVHFDVRDRSAYWIDWSRPGEAPRYQRRGEAPPLDATPEERAHVGEGSDDVADPEAESAAGLDEEGAGVAGRGRAGPTRAPRARSR